MSINQIMSTSMSALLSSQNQISVAANNISHASNPGYTRKTYEVTTVTSGAGMTLGEGILDRASNAILSKSVNTQSADLGKTKVINDYMSYYDSSIGTTDGENLTSQLSNLQAAFNELSAQPDSEIYKGQVVQSSQSLSLYVKELSQDIQSLRTEADQQIPDVVNRINGKLDNLERLNNDISELSSSGKDVTNLMDEQDLELEELSNLTGIQYFKNSEGQVTVYSDVGGLLLGTQANHIEYTASGSLSGDEIYPSSIGGITLNGKDITGKLQDGELGGLIDLRDDILMGEQEKLDEFSRSLIHEINKISNQGSAYPPPAVLTSDAGYVSADIFSGSGILNVVVVSQNGLTDSAQSIDLSSYGSIGALVTDLNNLNGLTASLSPDGQISLASDNDNNGVVLSGAGTDVNNTGEEFSEYFGFNDIFKGNDTASIEVYDGIVADPSSLPTSGFQASSGLTAGGRALSASDNNLLSQMVGLFDKDISFDATSASTAQTNSLNNYSSSLVSDAALIISNSQIDYGVSEDSYNYLKNMLSNETGVNIDEETALLTQYQNLYEANARLISIAQEMYDILFNMAR